MSDSLWPHGIAHHGIPPWNSLCPWGFSRQEYYSGWPCPPPGDLPNPGIKPRSPTLLMNSSPSEPPGKPKNTRVGSLSRLQGNFQIQELNWVSCIADRFFISWATREAYIYASVQSLSRVQLFATPWTAACQAPLSIGFSREEYWSGMPCPPPGGLPDPGPTHVSYVSCIDRWALYHQCHLESLLIGYT